MIEQIPNLFLSIQNIKFAEPVKLQLLAVPLAFFILSIILWLFWLYRRPNKTYGSSYPILGRFKFWIANILFLALLIGVWARPYINKGSLIVKRGNAEVIFLVDYSASMLLKDTGISRIDIASRELLKLPALQILKEGDRAALYILGLQGVRFLPLTSDLSSFVSEVSKLGIPDNLLASNIYWGSDIGSALERVYTSLDRQDAFVTFKGKNPSPGWRPEIKSNRLVVFIGDGDYFNYDDPKEKEFEKEDKEHFEAGLNEFRKRGLKIYPIGIGTRSGGKVISILDNFKRESEYDPKLEEDLKGQESRLNAYHLEYMRNATGADRLFLIENLNADASSFLKTVIDGHRNISIDPGITPERQEVWKYFAILALGVFILGALITKF